MPVCAGDLPETDFDFCAPKIRLSEIQRVFLALPQAAEFDDWFNPVSWNARLSQDSTDHNAIRALTCIGDKPAPTSTRKVISGGRKKTTSKTHTLFITIDEVSDLNHAFIQKLKNGKKFRMWYESAGGLMFGGGSGIIVTVYGDMVLLRGKDEIITYELQIVWDSLRTEDWIDSPIFEPPGGGEPGEPLTMTVILYPRMGALSDGGAAASIAGTWRFHMYDEGEFVNAYPLAAFYSVPTNRFFSDKKEDWFSGGGGLTVTNCTDLTASQPAKMVSWQIPYVANLNRVLCYCPVTENTLTFTDIMGNTAWCTPLIILHRANNEIRDYLVPKVFIEQLYSTDSLCTVRLYRTHPNPAETDMTDLAMVWRLPAGIDEREDPSDPTNIDKILVDLPAGTFTIGVEFKATSIIYSNAYPKSRLSFVLGIS